jgi:glycogen(starch) synthase
MKIAFFSWESLYSEKIGGLASASTHLAETLAREHEVHFFTRGEGDETINGVHYHYVRPRGDNIVAYCGDMSEQAVRLFHEYDQRPFDILHFHDWHFVQALHHLKDRNTVLTYHSTEYGRNGNKFGDWWEFGEISGKEWYGGLIARRCTAVSRTLKEEVQRLYNVPEWKIDVVQNGIVPEQFYAPVDPAEVKRQYGIHPEAPLVFFGGRMTFQKGPDILLAAIPDILKHRWDAHFIFAGEGDMREALQEKARRLPAAFLGFVPDTAFVNLLNSSDIVAIPSRNEPFGLILTEAWSAERCVVASDVGGLGENIDHFVNGIKVQHDPSSLAEGVNAIIDDRLGMRSLGIAGKKKVLREFLWNRITHRMMDVYGGALG